MPAGAGRKGVKVAKKKATRKCHPIDKNRVPLDTTPPIIYQWHTWSCPQLSTIYVSVLQVRRMYLHISLILLLHVTGRDTVVLHLEQHIHVMVIGMLTVTRVHQQVQCIHLIPICTLMRGLQTSYSPWPAAPGTLPPQFSSPHPPPPPPTPHPPPMSGSDGSDSGPYKVCFKIGNICMQWLPKQLFQV